MYSFGITSFSEKETRILYILMAIITFLRVTEYSIEHSNHSHHQIYDYGFLF